MICMFKETVFLCRKSIARQAAAEIFYTKQTQAHEKAANKTIALWLFRYGWNIRFEKK